MNASWHAWMINDTYKWFIPLWRFHVNESYIWMSYANYEWVTARMNYSWHIYMALSPVTLSPVTHYLVPWLIRMCDMTHLYMCHDSFICITWLIHTCALTQSSVWSRRSQCRHSNKSCHTCKRVTSHIWMSHVTHVKSLVTHMNEPCHLYV